MIHLQLHSNLHSNKATLYASGGWSFSLLHTYSFLLSTMGSPNNLSESLPWILPFLCLIWGPKGWVAYNFCYIT